MYLSTSTSTQDWSEMYLSTFQVLYKLYLSTDVLKYKVLLPSSGELYLLENVLKIPSKWENLAHNGLIWFFQHNYIPTSEQWLWDRVCVLSTWFGDICGSRRDFCMFYKRSGPLISNSIRCGCLRTDQSNIACSKAAVNGSNRRPPARRRRTVPCDLRRASLPVCFLILCDQRSGVVFIRFSGPRFPVLVDIRLVTVNRHARCSL